MYSKNIEQGQKNWTGSKRIEHGQNIFELADGMGKNLICRNPGNYIETSQVSLFMYTSGVVCYDAFSMS